MWSRTPQSCSGESLVPGVAASALAFHTSRGLAGSTLYPKDVDDSNIGLNGSPTKIAKASDKVRKGAGETVTPDSPKEAVDYIMAKLAEKHVI